jgi:hypothetical protein
MFRFSFASILIIVSLSISLYGQKAAIAKNNNKSYKYYAVNSGDIEHPIPVSFAQFIEKYMI